MPDVDQLQADVLAAQKRLAVADAATLASYVTMLNTGSCTVAEFLAASQALAPSLGDPDRKAQAAGLGKMLQGIIDEVTAMAASAAAAAQ